MIVLGEAIELDGRSEAQQRYDAFIDIGALQKFYPQCWDVDEIDIRWAVELVGHVLPWEFPDDCLTWTETETKGYGHEH